MLNPDEKLAYRVQEVVYATGLGRSKVYELIKDGTLETTKVGGCTLVRASSVRAMVGAPEPAEAA